VDAPSRVEPCRHGWRRGQSADELTYMIATGLSGVTPAVFADEFAQRSSRTSSIRKDGPSSSPC